MARLLLGLLLAVLAHPALAVPVIRSVTPNHGPVGSTVVIAGTGFGATPAENSVRFGTIRAEITAASATSLTVRVPTAASLQPITVHHAGLVAHSPLPFVPTFVSNQDLSEDAISAPIATPSLNTPHGVLGDLDGDGKLDIVFANYHSGSMSIFRNLNMGTSLSWDSFGARIDFPTGSGPQGLTIGDADGDGKIDVVVPNDFGRNVSVYRNISSPGSFTTSSLAEPVNFPAGNNPVAVVLADIDGDGKPDLVVANAVLGPSTVSVHRNTGAAGSMNANSFAPGVHFPTGNHSFRIAAGDLDGDGKLDVVVGNVGGNILSILHNTSVPGQIDGASFAPTISLTLPMQPYDVALADLDGDGKLDIAVNGAFDVSIALRNLAEPGVLTASSFAPPVQLAGGGTEIRAADLDGDGRPDLAVAGFNGVATSLSLYLNQSTPGTLQFGSPITVPGGGERFDVGDLNGDGAPDFVTGRDQARGSGIFLVQNLITHPHAVPSILAQPQDQTAMLGQTVSFQVAALGARPLTYQWYAGEDALTAGTNRTLTLSNVAFAQAGDYHVVVTNNFGATTSTVATLVVTYPPATVRVVSAEAPASGTADVAIELVANGDENALGFSLSFDPLHLSYISAALGAEVLDGSLTINDAAATSGRLGVELRLPPGQTFAAGTPRVLILVFGVAPVSEMVSSPVRFGDEPVQRRLSNKTAGLLAANYENGTVSVLPSTIRAGSAETATGGSVTVPITLLALGHENAVSFSIGFNPTILALAGVQVAGGLAPETSLLVNNNDLANGQVGISLALPAGARFERGPHGLVQLQFEVATVLNPLTTPIQFGDSPTVRQLANRDAQPMPAVFQDGGVSIVSVVFEADVAPRPGGDNLLSLIDWVQAGRFAAALDTIEPGEFQRVDCAPRATRGNGVISVADWVQAGRYSAQMDPITGIGGPTSESGAGGAGFPAAGGGCAIHISNTNVLPGATLKVPVVVSSTGAENALGFSVSFDPARLHFLGATKLSAIDTAMLNINANQAASGKVGVAFALALGSVLAAGSNDVVLLTLEALPNASGTTALEFGDAPVLREAVGVSANTLPSTFSGGQITLGPPPVVGPTLRITHSGDSVLLYWPAAKDGFELHSADAPSGGLWTKVAVTPVEIGGQKLVTLARTGDPRYFRLRKP